jgi:HSP20 family protein
MADRGQSWMWAEACMLIEKAERMHRRFFELLASPESGPAWEPPANIFITDQDLEIMVAVPGADPTDVAVQIVAGGLQIDARVLPPSIASQSQLVRLEIPYGRMRRRFDLPPGLYTVVERRHANGCLYLRLRGSPS